MKLSGVKNETHFIFSVGHYDCRAFDILLADGGQPGLHDFAGYQRFSGEPAWADLPNVTFADLFNDYRNYPRTPRKYGIHALSEVKILSDSDCPDTESFFWRRNNAIWGSRGKSGIEPLKYILLTSGATDHLINILKYNVDLDKKVEINAYIYSILIERGWAISDLDEVLETEARIKVKRFLSGAGQKFSGFQ